MADTTPGPYGADPAAARSATPGPSHLAMISSLFAWSSLSAAPCARRRIECVLPPRGLPRQDNEMMENNTAYQMQYVSSVYLFGELSLQRICEGGVIVMCEG
uniref:Uncharacterized protein n=1 Tax=Oryza meridionalis TaxID=40149 RepID=A0A0E0C2R1_9ORYZ